MERLRLRPISRSNPIRAHLIPSGLLLAALAAGACSKDNPTTPTPPTTCSFSVAQPTLTTFPPEGGTGTAAVTAGASCAWTAASNAAFITITQGSTGTANGTVQFTVAANGDAERTGTLTIAGTTSTITQRARTLTPVSLSAPAPRSPSGNQEVTARRPALVVDNAVATGDAGAVTYRFEVSDRDSFDPARTFAVDGIPQGSGTTSWTVDRDLATSTHFFWRAQATNGTVTSAYSNVEAFTTATGCVYTLSTRDVAVIAGGGTATVTVTADNACSWTAVSTVPFITVTSGASGTANGTVTLTVAPNTTGAARTGTVTIAGQAVTVSQAATKVIAGFRLIDPGRQPTPVTECQIRSLGTAPTLCVLESTSFTTGTSTINTYTWTVSYNYPSPRNLTLTGTNPQFNFSEVCGQSGSTDAGAPFEVQVALEVIDSEGTSVTVRSNSGSQPMLTLRAFTCGL